MARCTDGRGFTLVELTAVVGLMGVAAAVAVPPLGDANRAGRLARCEAQLGLQGAVTAAYALDHSDRIITFSWGPDDSLSQWDDLNEHNGTYVQAAANQATDIIRRRTNNPRFVALLWWLPNVSYSGLVMADYAGWDLPVAEVACPEDAVRRCWQANPKRDNAACPRPQNHSPNRPFSSSYSATASSYSFDRRLLTAQGQPLYTFSQGSQHNTFYLGVLPLGTRKVGSVAFPSAKVHLFDVEQRHFGDRNVYYAYPSATQPLLFFDGSVVVRRTKEANLGFRPNVPDVPNPTQFYYWPDPLYECAAEGEDGRDIVSGYYQWTRNGLGGVDFGASEVWDDDEE